MGIKLGVIIFTGAFAIYRNVLAIVTWYIVPPCPIEPATMVKLSIGENTSKYALAEVYWRLLTVCTQPSLKGSEVIIGDIDWTSDAT